MNDKQKIVDMTHKESKAWETGDVELLLSLFSKNFVMPFANNSYNPLNWTIPQGKFDYKRWKRIYENFFNERTLVHNKRKIIKISIVKDAALVVVHVDTLWKLNSGELDHWLGLAAKIYTKSGGIWKYSAHSGLWEERLR